MTPKSNIRHLLWIAVVGTALVTGAATYLLTQSLGHGPASSGVAGQESGGTAGTERKIVYWRAPMDPMEIYDAPGKSKMGMDLVPVYEDEVGGGSAKGDEARKIVYWRAPMDPTEIYDAPGKSKMGMDLVPVYEDELVGGVEIKIDPVVRQNMGLRIALVKQGDLATFIRTYGHVTYDDTRTFAVSAKAGGWIETLHADYTGFFVTQGDPLYEIYSPALVAAQEEYLTAFKTHARGTAGLNREFLASARKRLSYFDISETEILALEASGTVAKTLTIRSPYTGVVTRKNVVEGAFVKPGDNLFALADLSRVWVEAHIFEYEQHLVSVGQEARMILRFQPDKIFSGKIAYVFPYLQPKTRDVVIRLEFDNPDLVLKPDMFANIEIETGKGRQGLFIPSEAVIHSGEESLVFVGRGSGKFAPRKVSLGLYLENGNVEVTTGLAKDELVVTSGQFLLDSESKLKEAIQKMMEINNPQKPATEKPDEDGFFDDMEPKAEDDFFKDMTQGES